MQIIPQKKSKRNMFQWKKNYIFEFALKNLYFQKIEKIKFENISLIVITNFL